MNGKYTESSSDDPTNDDTQMTTKSESDDILFPFDTVKFIAEVEKRPAIYNHEKVEYADRSVRATAWTEVCQIMVPNWSSLSRENKIIEAKALKSKWRNMRDYFIKEFKYVTSKTPDQSFKKRKRCVYYDQLLFLVPNAKTRQEEQHEQEMSMAQDVTDEEYTGDTSAAGTFEFVTTSDYQNSVGEEASMASSNDEYLNVLRIQKKHKPPQDDNEDYDRMFLLSLLPMMRKLPEEKKLDVRIQMQQAIAIALKEHQNYA